MLLRPELMTPRHVYSMAVSACMFVSYAAYISVTKGSPVFLTEWAWMLCALTFLGIGVVDVSRSRFLASVVAVAVMRTVGLQIIVAIGSFVLIYSDATVVRDALIDYSIGGVLLGNFVSHILPLLLLFVCLCGWPREWRQTLSIAMDRTPGALLWASAAAVNCAVLIANFTYVDPTNVYGTSFDTAVYLVPMLCFSALVQTIVFYV